jgi:hypothetical protein
LQEFDNEAAKSEKSLFEVSNWLILIRQVNETWVRNPVGTDREPGP